MAYATYVLLVGYILGLRNAFSPDSLATTASSALVWLILEIGIIYLTLTVMSINTSLTKWDILSFSSYKYVGIIVVLMLGLLLNSKGYYIGWIYVSAALMFFLLRTLKLRIEPEVSLFVFIKWIFIFLFQLIYILRIKCVRKLVRKFVSNTSSELGSWRILTIKWHFVCYFVHFFRKNFVSSIQVARTHIHKCGSVAYKTSSQATARSLLCINS